MAKTSSSYQRHHLTDLCKEFELWYNSWRPHMTLDGIRPDDVFYNNKPNKPERDAKTVPTNVDQQQLQITILQKGLQKKHTNKRYTLRVIGSEKLHSLFQFINCLLNTVKVRQNLKNEGNILGF